MSEEKLHTVTIRVPFYNPSHALVALRGLQVDKEQNSIFVQRQLSTEGNDVIVTYSATTVRLLRLATNTFLSSCDLVIRTMEEFAPDPQDERISDEQLERERNVGGGDGGGGGKGIELKGNGVGAGSGQEIGS